MRTLSISLSFGTSGWCSNLGCSNDDPEVFFYWQAILVPVKTLVSTPTGMNAGLTQVYRSVGNLRVKVFRLSPISIQEGHGSEP